MNSHKLLGGLCAALVVAVAPLAAFADQHEAPPNLAEVWRVVPKPGQTQQFEEALKKHLAFRESHGDSRAWKTYVPVIGDDLSFYAIRYCCVRWADMDTYNEWSREQAMGQNWTENVDPYVASYAHYLSEIDLENSHWPEDDSGYRYFGVTSFQPRMGAGASMEQSKAMLSKAAKEGGWQRHWSWSNGIGGEGGLALVSPYRNYAEMAPPEQSFPAFLAERMGSQEKAAQAMKAFTDNFEGSSYTVYRLVDDLSMQGE